MENTIENILRDIELIIAKIGNYDIGKLQLSEQGRKDLTQLFRDKVTLAKSIKKLKIA